jgi:hypothetical protein
VIRIIFFLIGKYFCTFRFRNLTEIDVKVNKNSTVYPNFPGLTACYMLRPGEEKHLLPETEKG